MTVQTLYLIATRQVITDEYAVPKFCNWRQFAAGETIEACLLEAIKVVENLRRPDPALPWFDRYEEAAIFLTRRLADGGMAVPELVEFL